MSVFGESKGIYNLVAADNQARTVRRVNEHLTIAAAWMLAISGFVRWNIRKGNSTDTVTTRRQHLERLARTIGIADPWAVDGPTLLAWFERQPWATETRRCHRTSLSMFYAWGLGEGTLTESPADYLPRIQPARPNPRPAPDSVYLPALRVATSREVRMLRLAAEHGLRRGEIARVHSRDVIEDLVGWTLVVHGKGSKDRTVPLLDDVAVLLRALPAGWAFPGDDHGHLSPRWVGTLIGRLLPDAWTMHKLRHRAATKWWEASGYDTFHVQELLGHASPVTTRMYVATSSKRLREIVNDAAKAPPAAA